MQKREPVRYLENAKEILNKSQIEDSIYIDEKYVRSACGTAYLAVLKAIDEYLLNKGLNRRELPKKVEEYTKALQKYAGQYNGKLIRQFDRIYDELHIAGYYRGLLKGVGTVKDAMKAARDFIEKLK